MALVAWGELPFGIRDVRILPLVGDTPGTGIDVPRIRTVDLGVESDSTELEGDDVRVAIHSFGKRLTGSIEAGGINLDALAVMEGGAVTPGGVLPNRIVTYAVLGTQSQGYFKLIGHMYGDDAGDLHIIAYRVKATSGPNYSFNNGEFALTNCDLEAVFNTAVPSKLYDLVSHETITALV
jgi:hypothetical protein